MNKFNLTSSKWLARVDPRNLLVRKIDFPKYSILIGYPVWDYFLQFINRTRSYEHGLDVGFLLLTLAEQYREKLTQEEHEIHLAKIYTLILTMLDKLDQWEDFIASFDLILANTKLSFGSYYAEESRSLHLKNGATEFLLCDVPGGFKLHFLYEIAYRRRIINNKIKKKKASRRIGNLLHKRQDELSDAELNERANWVLEFIRMNQMSM